MEPDGDFNHNPEPLPENLELVSSLVPGIKADLGFVVDPDVDRLAIICEDGSMFGEEYTLVAVADYVLGIKPGTTVSNLSSTISLKVVTESHGCRYFSSSVGEVNVVNEMKKRKSVVGGEGNGGIILPELHYGRDALVGIALFLTHLARSRVKCSELRKKYPDYIIAKKKVTLTKKSDYTKILKEVRKRFNKFPLDERDGLKVELPDGWIQIRKSNTEPIMRIYSEAADLQSAETQAAIILNIVKKY
jgi:phosphomannomutase